MIRKYSCSDEQGFSLVETMVVLGLSGFVGLGVATLMMNQNQGKVRAELQSNFLQLRNSLQATANNPAAVYGSAMKTSTTPIGVTGGGVPVPPILVSENVTAPAVE